jgi:enoyl-CoA hydratase/carnithine racemase
MNSLDMDTLLELENVLNVCETDDNIGAVIITGSGKAFCAGADLKYQLNVIANNLSKEREFINRFRKITDLIAELSKPVIAAINGFALAGGFEILMACDLAIAADGIQIGDQHMNYALLPGGGSSQRLPWIVGMRRAKEILFTGKWLTAVEAGQLGIVNKVVPADQLESAAMQMAADLASKSRLSLKEMKRLVNNVPQMSLKAGIDIESQACIMLVANEDANKGLVSFNTKPSKEA